MADGDGGWFLGNRAPELAETSQAFCHQPCTIPHKTVCQMDAWFSSYGKNKFCSMCFFFKSFCKCLHGRENWAWAVMQVWRWWRRSWKIAWGLLNPWGSYHVNQTASLKSISSFLQFLQELPVEAQWRSTMKWKRWWKRVRNGNMDACRHNQWIPSFRSPSKIESGSLEGSTGCSL